MTKGTVTALLPAFQAADFIQETLDSLSSQTLEHLRVIVSVDSCDDDTYSICAQHAERDQRFAVRRQHQRLGWIGNSNELLRCASTDYAFFAFHDDIVAPTYAEKLANVLDEHSDAVLSYSDTQATQLNGRTELWQYDIPKSTPNNLVHAQRIFEREGKWWVPMRGLFRVPAAKMTNGLKLHGGGEFSADRPWLFHMSLLGKFIRVPEVLCFKNYKQTSLSKSWLYSRDQLREASAGCIRELWTSQIATDEKIMLSSILTDRLLKNPH